MTKPILLILAVLLLSSCTQSITQYQGQNPKLDLKTFFNGQLVAHGLIQDISGNVTRRFKADLNAQWQGDQGLIDEVFYFSDGEVDYRCWRIEKNGDKYTGRAGDVIGEAVGEVVGNTLNWQYDLVVETDNGELTLFLDDWLYLIDDSTLLNKTDMNYFGITVATLTLSISKTSQQPHEKLKACL
jgi:hypothetical protein